MKHKTPHQPQIYIHESIEQLGKIIQTLWSAPAASPLDQLKLN
ncbi:MAG: hypothetical protein ACK44D_01740 [Bacteroidia bacterium]